MMEESSIVLLCSRQMVKEGLNKLRVLGCLDDIKPDAGFRMEHDLCEKIRNEISARGNVDVVDGHSFFPFVDVHFRHLPGEKSTIALADTYHILDSVTNVVRNKKIMFQVRLTSKRDIFRSQLTTKEMCPEEDSEFLCQDQEIDPSMLKTFSSRIARSTNREGLSTVELTLKLVIRSEEGAGNESVKSQLVRMNKMIMEDEVGSNVTIVPGSGNPVKCHLEFLVANCPVFGAMFRSEMSEKATGTIEMKEMTEKGIRAFMDYFYTRDISKPNDDFELAIELLAASHKYAIKELQTLMTSVIIDKPVEWFQDIPEAAIDLFLLARLLDDGAPLKRKAVCVIKRYCAVLRDSSVFQEIFHHQPDIAMDLFQESVDL